jgi:DNA modification methylase
MSATATLNVTSRPIRSIRPYEKNPRVIPAEAIDAVARSIASFGFQQPIVVDKEGVIIVGHTRYRAALKLGMKEVPVHVAEKLSPEQVKAYRIADNSTHSLTTWDTEILQLELGELSNYDFGDFGLDLDALEPLHLSHEDDFDVDAAVANIKEPKTQPGDVWMLDKHRIICGDCTKADIVSSLLGEAKPFLLVTDPPYGIELDSEWRDRAGLNGGAMGVKRTPAMKEAAKTDHKHHAEPSYMKHRTEGHTVTTISGDTRADWSEAYELVPSLTVAYVWHASIYTRDVLNGLERIGFLYPQQIIWDKGKVVLTRTHYWYQHEPCWYVRKKRAPWHGNPGSDNSTIWFSPSPKFIMGGSDEPKFDHPTQKPIELMRRPLLNHTKRGDLVYDPFLGSGTTLMAAEQLERVCYGVELDPVYCDVIVGRWEKMTGNVATR